MTIIEHCAVCDNQPANIICPYCSHPPVQVISEEEQEVREWRKLQWRLLAVVVVAVIILVIACQVANSRITISK